MTLERDDILKDNVRNHIHSITMYKLKYAISKVKDGNMGYRFSSKEELLQNKTKFLENSGFNLEDTVCMKVQMLDNLEFVKEKDKGRGTEGPDSAFNCDALITTNSKINLFLVVADCLPIIIFDKKIGILSLIHSSWSNTDKYIVPKVLKEFKKLDCNFKDIEVVIGPGIQKDSLIYDKNIFEKTTSDWGKYIEKVGEDKYSVDNLGYTIKQLEDSGIGKEQIKIHDIDTYKDENYFSHVRDFRNGIPDQGRFAMVARFE